MKQVLVPCTIVTYIFLLVYPSDKSKNFVYHRICMVYSNPIRYEVITHGTNYSCRQK